MAESEKPNFKESRKLKCIIMEDKFQKLFVKEHLSFATQEFEVDKKGNRIPIRTPTFYFENEDTGEKGRYRTQHKDGAMLIYQGKNCERVFVSEYTLDALGDKGCFYLAERVLKKTKEKREIKIEELIEILNEKEFSVYIKDYTGVDENGNEFKVKDENGNDAKKYSVSEIAEYLNLSTKVKDDYHVIELDSIGWLRRHGSAGIVNEDAKNDFDKFENIPFNSIKKDEW